MMTVHFYDRETGLISHELRLSERNAEKLIAANTPAGHAPVFGVTDQLSQKVDIATGKLIDHQPERPDVNHEWDARRKRWIKRADVRAREEQRVLATARIEELEKRQARRVRELLAKDDQHLKAINDEIASLRAALSAGTDTSEL